MQLLAEKYRSISLAPFLYFGVMIKTKIKIRIKLLMCVQQVEVIAAVLRDQLLRSAYIYIVWVLYFIVILIYIILLFIVRNL